MRTNAEQLHLRSAALGPDRLLVGAAEIAFEPVLADPLRVDPLSADALSSSAG